MPFEIHGMVFDRSGLNFSSTTLNVLYNAHSDDYIREKPCL